MTTAAVLLAVLPLAPVTADGQTTADAKTKTEAKTEVPAKPKGGPFPRQLTVYDRQGKVVRTVGEPGNNNLPALSPDGTRLAVVARTDPGRTLGTQDIRVFDLSTGARTQVTSDDLLATSPGIETEGVPVWSPDGSQIAYYSYRQDYGGLYRKASNGTGSEELLYRHTLGASMFITDWSPDGRFLLFQSGGVLYVLPLTTGERKAVELVREEFRVIGARLSPDSRFLAYRSDESGEWEVYVQPFDPSSEFTPGSGKWQVSNQGGLGMVQWRRDGRELYYLARDGEVMAVEVTTTPTFTAGPPRLLFRAPSTIPLEPRITNYVDWKYGRIGPDGQRVPFAVPTPPERKVVTVAPEILAKYTGTYVILGENNTDVVLTLEGNQLMLPLFAESETYFFRRTPNSDIDIEFVKDDKGAVLWAHHSYTTVFDVSKTFTLTGTLTRVDWRNPHIGLSLDAKSDRGQVEAWVIESMPPVFFRNRNISKSDFEKAIGQTVTMEVYRARDGTLSGSLLKLTFPDGKSVTSNPAA